MAQKSKDRKEGLDFGVVERPLGMLLVAVGNKIDREWPKTYASIPQARETFLITVRTAEITFRTIRFICADKPRDPFRKLEYSICVPPLSRTILDNIFTIVFILEDLPTRCTWYRKAGWREQKLELEQYKKEYGHLDAWRSWLAKYEGFVNLGVKVLGISTEEALTPASIPPWPNPGKMPRYGIKKGMAVPPSRAFLQYLNDWFYRDLSEQTHLSGSGLVKRTGFLVKELGRNPEFEECLRNQKSNYVMATCVLVLALASEIESAFKFELSDRINYLWGVFIEHSPTAKELYDLRYSNLLR